MKSVPVTLTRAAEKFGQLEVHLDDLTFVVHKHGDSRESQVSVGLYRESHQLAWHIATIGQCSEGTVCGDPAIFFPNTSFCLGKEGTAQIARFLGLVK